MTRTMMVALLCTLVPAAGTASAQAIFERPGLVTSVGQSSDIAIVKVVLNTQLKLGLEAKPLAQVSDLEGMKTLVVVVGASTKGLGAAGLDVDKEVARGTALVKAAKARGMKVLVLHTGGEPRRGPTSNVMIEAVVPLADHTAVVVPGNKDGLFDKLTVAPAGLSVVDKITVLGPAIAPLFK